jgi:hypothetical protein
MSETIESGKAGLLLADCVSSVFADMAFIDVQEVLDGDLPGAPAETAGERCVAIDVLAPLSCRIELRINNALRDKIVENLFGEAPDSVQKKNGEDSLLEMLNIIAGTFLSAYFGSGVEIQLELPQYLYFQEQSQGQIVSKVHMTAEGEPLTITLHSVRYRY